MLLTAAPWAEGALLASPAPALADWSLGEGAQRLRLTTVVSPPAGPLASLVPIDETLPARLETLAALWRLLQGRGQGVADPISPQRRQRLMGMLRAWDARAEGAPHREIANALYGETRVADAPWKTSSLRDATLRLVRDGARMVRGGYRNLLR